MRIRIPVLGTLLVLVVAAGCSSGDDDPVATTPDEASVSDDPAVAHVSAYASEEASPVAGLEADGARCVVDELGADDDILDDVTEHETFQELTVESRTQVVAAARRCEPEFFAAQLAEQVQLGTGLTDEEAACIGEQAVRLPPEDLLVLASFGQDLDPGASNMGDIVLDLLGECGLTFLDLMPDETLEP